MKMVKKIAMAGITTLMIVGCGGGGSGDTSAPVTPAPVTPMPAPAVSKCTADGDTVLVPEGGKCTYSIPNVNGGAAQTYSCTNGVVSSNGISGRTITFNDTTFICQ